MPWISARICFKEVQGVLKLLTSLHKWLAADTNLADGKFFCK